MREVSYKVSEPETLRVIGVILVMDVATLQVLEEAAVGDISDVLQYATLGTTDEASEAANQFVDGGGKLLQSAEDKAQAVAQGVQNIVEGGSQKVEGFVEWLVAGSRCGYVGDRTQAQLERILFTATSFAGSPNSTASGTGLRTSTSVTDSPTPMASGTGLPPASAPQDRPDIATSLNMATMWSLEGAWGKQRYHVESDTAMTAHRHTLPGFLIVALVLVVMAVVAFWRLRTSITVQSSHSAHAHTISSTTISDSDILLLLLRY
jgi:hypothetical protein